LDPCVAMDRSTSFPVVIFIVGIIIVPGVLGVVGVRAIAGLAGSLVCDMLSDESRVETRISCKSRKSRRRKFDSGSQESLSVDQR
jgi:hypothetical protein